MESSKSRTVIRIINKLINILPAFFWTFLIFGFEEPTVAIISISAAIIHEIGHILCILAQRGRLNLRSVVSGFRITKEGSITYEQEILSYVSGPLANVILFLLLSLAAPLLGEWAFNAAIINLATAVSNLLPIEGYDGYGILRALLQKREADLWVLRLIKRISSGLIFTLAVFSLYLIDRLGGGYWIFAVFFFSMIKSIKDDLE